METVLVNASGRSLGGLAWPAAFLSAALLGFEIVLLRLLLVASWHHFAFLVISVALLGFGASGTVLCLLRPWLLRKGEAALFYLALATAVSMPLCASLAQQVPVEARFVPDLLLHQAGAWLVYWGILGLPFLLGAAALGFTLMLAAENVAFVYAANLAGGAVGAALATLAMLLLPPAWLPAAAGALAVPGALSCRSPRRAMRGAAVGAAVLALVVTFAFHPPQVRLDPYKYGAYVERLEKQDSAVRLASGYGARSKVELYRGEGFHDLPFLSVEAEPPRLDVIVADGHWSASLLRIDDVGEAAALDHTLTAAAYALLEPLPRVLLLGEAGGVNVWLAARHGARTTRIVQTDGAMLELLAASEHGRAFLELPGVAVSRDDPRHFVEHTGERFDLIQMVTLESTAAGSGGIGGLAEDHLVTVEGVTASLRALSDSGLLSVCRGIQSPPRDNLKLLATAVAALGRLGVARPAHHVAIVRDYLAVCTLVRRTPFSPLDIERIRTVVSERRLTPVWFTGVRADELNRPDRLPGPSEEIHDGEVDWYHHGANELFSQEADVFVERWIFDIRPPTDDRPFFLDFGRLGSIGALREAFGELWLTRAELAYLFVLVTTAIIAGLSAVLTIVPLLLLRDVRTAPGKGAAAAYFGAIGLGYMLLEMVMLSRLTHLIGDPVLAAAVTVTAFLLLSGIGSATVHGLGERRYVPTAWLMAILLAVAAVTLAVLDTVVAATGGLPLPARACVAVAAVGPLAFLMGFPMPVGLGRLHEAAPALVPWAWGVNGFASVLAAPLAMAIAMSHGFGLAAVVALVAYAAAALLSGQLGGVAGAGGRSR